MRVPAFTSDLPPSRVSADPGPSLETRIELLENRIAPAVVLTVSDMVDAAAPGDALAYTIDFANDGDDDAAGVVLADMLPAGTRFDPALNPDWTADGDLLTFAVGALAAGAAGSASLILKVDDAVAARLETIENTVTVTRSDIPDFTGSATDTNALDAAPDLVLTKTDGVENASPGSTLTYALNTSNAGTQDATGVVIADTLPAGTNFDPDSNPGWALDGTALTFAIGDLAAGESGAATLILTVADPLPGGLTAIENTASIGDDGQNGADPTPADNTATDVDAIVSAVDLTLSVSGAAAAVTPGSQITYTLNYANNGDVNATGVVITDTLPAGTSFDPDANPGWTLDGTALTFAAGDLAAGAGGAATLVLDVNSTFPAGVDGIQNSASIADDGANGADSNPGNNAAAAAVALDAAPDLVLTLTDGVDATAPGGTLSFTLGFTNAGSQDATGVILTDALPVGTSFDAGLNAGWTLDGTTLTFVIGGLAAGGAGSAALVLSVDAAVPAGLDGIVNTASISDDGAGGADPTPENNAVTGTQTLDAAPDLVVTQTSSGASVSPGGLITYSLTYSNAGNQAATGVFLTETLPANTTFVAAGSTAGWTETTPGSGIFRFAIGDLAAGEPMTVSFQIRVAATLPGGAAQFANSVSIADDGANGADQTPANNTSSLTASAFSGVYAVASGNTRTVAGEGPKVEIYDSATGQLVLEFLAYKPGYKGSVRAALGDLNGDGVADIITSSRDGSGKVRFFDGQTGQRLTVGGLTQLDPFNAASGKGAFVAAGDVNGDGTADIILSKGVNGNRVKVYDGATGALAANFKPFAQNGTGVQIGAGDVNGDGRADIIAGQKNRGGEVRVFSGAGLSNTSGPIMLLSLSSGFKTGVFVSGGDVDGDGRADVIAGSGADLTGAVKVFSGANSSLLYRIPVFTSAPVHGVRVGVADVNSDGIADIVAAAGGGGNSQVAFFDGTSGIELSGRLLTPFPGSTGVGLRIAGLMA